MSAARQIVSGLEDTSTAAPFTVVQYEREPKRNAHSIERVFDTVRQALPATVHVKRVPCPSPGSSLWLVRGLIRAWQNRGAVNHIVGDIHYVALALPRRSIVLTVHDFRRYELLTGLRKQIYRWLYITWPISRAAVVTTISDHTRTEVIRLVPSAASKTRVIPNPLPAGHKPALARCSTGKRRILQVGTAEHKNLERVIEALADVDCVLHIVGPLSASTRRLLEQTGIDFENDVNLSDEELALAYERCDCVVFVSLFEGFGMPVIEAQAAGRPVVTSSLSPMKDVAGTGACLVDPYSVSAIRAAVEKVLDDGAFRSAIVSRGLENVRRFSPRTISDQYTSVFLEILQGGSTSKSTAVAER